MKAKNVVTYAGSQVECVLRLDKETDNKLRWSAEISEVPFSIYIPKHRVPSPVPHLIYVAIEPNENPRGSTRAPAARVNSWEPITASVEQVSQHSKTIRYRPTVGQSREWEIGEPYVPISLSFDGAQALTIQVRWRR